MGSKAKIAELMVSVYETLGLEVGRSTSTLYPIDWRTTEDYGDPTAFKTGQEVVVLDGGYDPEQPIVLSGIAPLPCTVRAIVARMEVTGR